MRDAFYLLQTVNNKSKHEAGRLGLLESLIRWLIDTRRRRYLDHWRRQMTRSDIKRSLEGISEDVDRLAELRALQIAAKERKERCFEGKNGLSRLREDRCVQKKRGVRSAQTAEPTCF